MPMKVLFVFNHPAPYKVRLFNELCKDIDLDVIFERKSASDRPKDFYNCNRYDFNVKFLKKGAFSKENSNTKELKEYIANNYSQYDLIIMNGYSTITEIRAILYMKKHKIPFVLYVNGGVIRKEGFFKKKFKSMLIKAAYHYFSPCEEANKYLEYYGAKPSQISNYVYSTFYDREVIDEPLSEEDKNLLRFKFNLPKGKLFVSAGQFIPRKNNLQTIMEFIGRKDKLLLIGQGPEKSLYEQVIKDNGIENIILRDFVPKDELFKIMKCCDAFITLSKEDIFGHTTNEAMACGLPVISSNKVVASLHLIRNGYNGFIVDLDDEKRIQNVLSTVSYEMSECAIKTAKKNTIEAGAKAHVKMFKELVE